MYCVRKVPLSLKIPWWQPQDQESSLQKLASHLSGKTRNLVPAVLLNYLHVHLLGENDNSINLHSEIITR